MSMIRCVIVLALAACDGEKNEEASPALREQAEAAAKKYREERVDPITASQQAELAMKAAEAAAQQAVKEAQAAREQVETLMRELEAVDAKMNVAVDAVADAQNDADRTAAKEMLIAVRRDQISLQARMAEAKAAAARAERLKGVKISKECLENPLARGCL